MTIIKNRSSPFAGGQTHRNANASYPNARPSPIARTHAAFNAVVLAGRRGPTITSTHIALMMAATPIAFKYNSGSGISYFFTPSQSMRMSASSPIGPMAFLSKP